MGFWTALTKPRGKKNGRVFFRVGLGRAKEYAVQHLSLLIGSGVNMLTALEAISTGIRSTRMRRVIRIMKDDIETGSAFWETMDRMRIFPAHIVALVRIGEESGRLAENLQLIAIQYEKDRLFRGKLHSAMMYPLFVLGLATVIGLGIAWFVLPKLAMIFASLNVPLPVLTRALIAVGTFLGKHGSVVVPATLLALGAVGYFLFIFRKTKFIGQTLIFFTPGIGPLLRDIELGRYGYIMGTLLDAGVPVVEALDSLRVSGGFWAYRRLYSHLYESVNDGESFEKSFAAYRYADKLIPRPIQQMIISGEQSGKLSETFTSVGTTYEARTELATKNLSTILEPLLLVVVWLGVVAVALAVILPIYSLLGGVGTTGGAPPVPPPARVAPPAKPVRLPATAPPERSEAEPPAAPVPEEIPVVKEAASLLRILPTPTSYLNVRAEPSRAGALVTQVNPGEEYVFMAQRDAWYQIELPDGRSGWVIETYVSVIPPTSTP